jgi:hypothetical protein
MIHYTLNLLNIPFFNIIPNGIDISQKESILLYNTFNIHENATLPLLIPKYMFLFEEVFQIT